MSDDTPRDGIPDAVSPADESRAATDQADEQERLDDETRRRFGGDPGDPRDRLDPPAEGRLMEQQEQRDFHA
jgi:hypothetical protein